MVLMRRRECSLSGFGYEINEGETCVFVHPGLSSSGRGSTCCSYVRIFQARCALPTHTRLGLAGMLSGFVECSVESVVL